MTPSFHHRPRVGGELTESYETARENASTDPASVVRRLSWLAISRGSTDTRSVETRNLMCFVL